MHFVSPSITLGAPGRGPHGQVLVRGVEVPRTWAPGIPRSLASPRPAHWRPGIRSRPRRNAGSYRRRPRPPHRLTRVVTIQTGCPRCLAFGHLGYHEPSGAPGPSHWGTGDSTNLNSLRKNSDFDRNECARFPPLLWFVSAHPCNTTPSLKNAIQSQNRFHTQPRHQDGT